MLENCLVSKAHLLNLPEGKEDAIRAAVTAMADVVKLDADEVFEAVMERERVMSTGMGHGVAIPHAKIKGLKKFHVSFSRASAPIDYQSLDSTPVRILVLLLSPEDKTKEHVKLLTEITKRLKFSAVRQAFLDAKSTSEMEKAIIEHK